MPDIFAAGYKQQLLHSHSYGNAYNESHRFNFAAAIADKLFLGIIPAGTEVNDLKLINSAVANATITLGFEPDDPSGLPAAVANQWFPANTALATAQSRSSASQPIRFERDVRIVAVLAGAALLATDTLTVVVTGKVVNAR